MVRHESDVKSAPSYALAEAIPTKSVSLPKLAHLQRYSLGLAPSRLSSQENIAFLGMRRAFLVQAYIPR